MQLEQPQAREHPVGQSPAGFCLAWQCGWTPCLLLPLMLVVAAVIPPFHEAIDNAVLQLAPDGFLGAADFFVSGKYDTPMRQMHWGRRFFWR